MNALIGAQGRDPAASAEGARAGTAAVSRRALIGGTGVVAAGAAVTMTLGAGTAQAASASGKGGGVTSVGGGGGGGTVTGA
ncbi:MAG: hypothetical protein ACRDVE_04445, partial [Actinocrinis sp.]